MSKNNTILQVPVIPVLFDIMDIILLGYDPDAKVEPIKIGKFLKNTIRCK